MKDNLLSKRLIFADYFTSLHTREISGHTWNWRYYNGDNVQWSGDLYESVGSDRKETAAPFYPLIGPYDTLDPIVMEYHILLAKAAGIDGFLCEYDTHHSLDHEVVVRMAQIARKHDFKIGIHWIPINFTNRTPGLRDRVSMLEAAKTCLAAIFDQVYAVSGACINDRPLILIFGIRASDYLPTIVKDTFFSASEINALREAFKDKHPLFLAPHFQPELIESVDGFYPWILPLGSEIPPNSPYDKIGDQAAQRKHLHHFYSHVQKTVAENHQKLFMAGVWPGFDDHKGRAWGEDLARYVPRDNGRMLAFTWEMAEAANAETILHVTWNDWIESTIIEPSREMGYSELESTQEKINQWKNSRLDPNRLKKTQSLYTCRKQLNYLLASGAPPKTITDLHARLDKAAQDFSRFVDSPFNAKLEKVTQQLRSLNKHVTVHNTVWQWSPENSQPDFTLHACNHGIALQLKNQHLQTMPPGFWQGRIAVSFLDQGDHFLAVRQGTRDHWDSAHEIANFKLNDTCINRAVEMDLIHSRLASDPGKTFFLLNAGQPVRCNAFTLSLSIHTFRP